MKNIFPYLTKVTYVALGVAWFYLWIKCFFIWYYFLTVLFSIIVPLTIYFYYNKAKKYSRLNGIIALYVILSPFIFVFNSFYNAANDVHSLWKYESIISDFWRSQLVEHFPKEIPDNAGSILFSFRQQFLQRWWHIHLKINVEPDIYDNIYNEFKWKEPKNIDYPNYSSDFPNFREIGESVNEYKNIYLYSRPYKSPTETDHYWNHWVVSWTSFNSNNYNIIYWAEFW